MSENLRLLGKYSDAMASGSDDAVYEFFSPDFHSHVSERINPEVIGTDIRGSEQKWWREAKEAFPDMVFTIDLLIEKDDLIVSNWSVKGTHTGAPFKISFGPVEVQLREYQIGREPRLIVDDRECRGR